MSQPSLRGLPARIPEVPGVEVKGAYGTLGVLALGVAALWALSVRRLGLAAAFSAGALGWYLWQRRRAKESAVQLARYS